MIAQGNVIDAKMSFHVTETTPADELEIEVEVPDELGKDDENASAGTSPTASARRCRRTLSILTRHRPPSFSHYPLPSAADGRLPCGAPPRRWSSRRSGSWDPGKRLHSC